MTYELFVAVTSSMALVALAVSFGFSVFIRKMRQRGSRRYSASLYDSLADTRHLRYVAMFAGLVLAVMIIHIITKGRWLGSGATGCSVGTALGYLVRSHLYEDRN